MKNSRHLICYGTVGALLAASFLLSSTSSFAVPGYDGLWSVSIVTEKGDCDRGYRYPVRISNGTLVNAGDSDVHHQRQRQRDRRHHRERQRRRQERQRFRQARRRHRRRPLARRPVLRKLDRGTPRLVIASPRRISVRSSIALGKPSRLAGLLCDRQMMASPIAVRNKPFGPAFSR